jgi:hypothetical protein
MFNKSERGPLLYFGAIEEGPKTSDEGRVSRDGPEGVRFRVSGFRGAAEKPPSIIAGS